jgi:hypothetical protein
MSLTLTIDPAYSLSPSELVFLNGEMFAGKTMLGNMQLLHIDANVSISQLGLAVLSAAFLANEKIGTLNLETYQKKALLGLRKVTGLLAKPSGSPTNWPTGSLEAELLSLAQRRHASGASTDVTDLIYAWLAQDTRDPWKTVLDTLQSALADRGLLNRDQEKKLKIFTVTHYSLPDETIPLSGKETIEPIQHILTTCERERGEIWNLLTKHIKKAISARTEQDDTDFD